MRNLQPLAIVLVFAISTTFIAMTGCKKGDTGPKGPAGPDSVTYSNWTPLVMKDEGSDPNSSDATYQEELYDQTIKAPGITPAIINKGMVLTYLQSIDQTSKDTIIINAENVLSEITYADSIYLYSWNTDYSGYNFRYVVIPGTILATQYAGQTAQQIRSSSYATITKQFGIPARGASGSKLSTN